MIRVTILLLICAYFLGGCASHQNKGEKTAPPAPAAKAPVQKVDEKPVAKKMAVCVNGQDSRKVEVVASERSMSSAPNRVCEVIYTKNSKAESIASSNVSVVFCEDVLNKIQKNLESGGFSCKS